MREFAISTTPSWMRRLWAEMSLSLALGLALAFLGPFHTSDFDALSRTGFWVGASAAWFLSAGLSREGLARTPAWRDLPRPVRRGLVMMLATAPTLLLVTPAVRQMGVTVSDAPLWELYLKTLAVGGGLSLLSSLALGERPLAARFAPAVPPPSEPRLPGPRAPHPLEARLSPEVRGEIVCLRIEDHYVRVHTRRGSGLVLMRFSDAMAMFGGEEGLRVHRSWWVASARVRGVERQGRALRLRLDGDLTAPVSQPYAQAVVDRFGPA